MGVSAGNSECSVVCRPENRGIGSRQAWRLTPHGRMDSAWACTLFRRLRRFVTQGNSYERQAVLARDRGFARGRVSASFPRCLLAGQRPLYAGAKKLLGVSEGRAARGPKTSHTGTSHIGWVRNPIDAFVAAKLENKGIEPAARADRVTLIRRATFDLIGLPPTPEEVRAFVEDDSPEAFQKGLIKVT